MSNIQITSEDLLLDLPRGKGADECMRLRFVRAKTATGKEVSWHDLREWYQDSQGNWRPGKGVTVRGHELQAITDALTMAVDCMQTS